MPETLVPSSRSYCTCRLSGWLKTWQHYVSVVFHTDIHKSTPMRHFICVETVVLPLLLGLLSANALRLFSHPWYYNVYQISSGDVTSMSTSPGPFSARKVVGTTSLAETRFRWLTLKSSVANAVRSPAKVDDLRVSTLKAVAWTCGP